MTAAGRELTGRFGAPIKRKRKGLHRSPWAGPSCEVSALYQSQRAASKRFGEPEPVVDCRMNVSGCDGIADTEQLISAIVVRMECLLPPGDESRIVDLAAVDRALLQLEVKVIERSRSVLDDHQIDDLVRILPTPGHTPGHTAVYFGRDGADGVISGDLMHSPLQTRYPELSIVFDVDPAQAAVTRRKFLERYCDTSTLCCPAHFPSPSWGRIKRWGDGFRCEPVGA